MGQIDWGGEWNSSSAESDKGIMAKRKRPSLDNYDFGEEYGDKTNGHQHPFTSADDCGVLIVAAEGELDRSDLNATNAKRSVPVMPWLEEEDLKLIEAVSLYGWGNPLNIDWEKVSQHLNSDRSADQCSRRWNSAIKYRRAEYKALPWSKEEDHRLEEGVRRHHGQGLRGGIDWEKVKLEVGDQRTVNQCRGRWNGILKHRSPSVRTTPWTKEEDELLIEAVGINEGHGRRGSVNWCMVSQQLQGMRTAQQCSHRYHQHNKHPLCTHIYIYQ